MLYKRIGNCYTPHQSTSAESLSSIILHLIALAFCFAGALLLAGGLG